MKLKLVPNKKKLQKSRTCQTSNTMRKFQQQPGSDESNNRNTSWLLWVLHRFKKKNDLHRDSDSPVKGENEILYASVESKLA